MDVKVYKKEEVRQPSGTEYVYVPDVIDIIPNIVTNPDTGEEIITGAVELEDGSKELLEQECAIATIKQKGLDPLDLEDGIQWSETLLGEVNVTQLMEDIQSAIEQTTTSVVVIFDTVTDSKGRSYLTYTLKEVA